MFSLLGLLRYPHDLGLLRFFLLLNDSSHETHFLTLQNIEPGDFLEKKSNFSLNGFSRYLTLNMALQKIILTSFVFKLNNYVIQLILFTSVPARLGLRKIILLLNDSSHKPQFLAYQNMETLDAPQKISNFHLHRFFRYSTPNMAL